MKTIKTRSGKPFFTWRLIIIIFILCSIAICHDVYYNNKIKNERMYIVCEDGTKEKVYTNTTFACGYPCNYNLTEERLYCGWTQMEANYGTE